MVSVPGLNPGLLRYNARFKAWALRNVLGLKPGL